MYVKTARRTHIYIGNGQPEPLGTPPAPVDAAAEAPTYINNWLLCVYARPSRPTQIIAVCTPGPTQIIGNGLRSARAPGDGPRPRRPEALNAKKEALTCVTPGSHPFCLTTGNGLSTDPQDTFKNLRRQENGPCIS